jgi:hypothetical protein
MSVTHTIIPASKEVVAEWRSALAVPSDEGQTAVEISAITGINKNTLLHQMKKGLQNGDYIAGIAMRRRADGRFQRVPVYRIAPKKKKK